MSDDDSEQEQSAAERETSEDREEWERRRLDNDEDDASEEVVSDHDIDSTPGQPDQPEEPETEITDEASRRKYKEQLQIPQITADQSSQLDAAEQVEDTPADTDRTVDLPQVQPSSIELLDADDLTETVPVKADEGSIAVPQVTTRTTHRLAREELDDDQPDGLERMQQVQIPQITVAHRTRIRPFNTFLDTVLEFTSRDSDTATLGVTDETDEEQETAKAIESEEDVPNAVDECGGGRRLDYRRLA